MSEKKIVIPEGMIKAYEEAACDKYSMVHDWKGGLKAAIEWLAMNPIIPTDEQVDSLAMEHEWPNHKWMLTEWQRRMFLSYDSKVPKEIKSLLYGGDSNTDKEADSRIIEAYKIGKDSKNES